MHTNDIEQTLNAPVDKLWALVANFANLDWYEGPEKVEQIGEGVGQIRRITIPGMPEPIEEVLESVDEGSHTLSYRIPVNASNIMEDYVVRATLTDAGEGKTKAHWQATFSGIAGNVVEPQMMIDVMGQTYGGMMQQLEAAASA